MLCLIPGLYLINNLEVNLSSNFEVLVIKNVVRVAFNAHAVGLTRSIQVLGYQFLLSNNGFQFFIKCIVFVLLIQSLLDHGLINLALLHLFPDKIRIDNNKVLVNPKLNISEPLLEGVLVDLTFLLSNLVEHAHPLLEFCLLKRIVGHKLQRDD